MYDDDSPLTKLAYCAKMHQPKHKINFMDKKKKDQEEKDGTKKDGEVVGSGAGTSGCTKRW
jgi:hypothetical protein